MLLTLLARLGGYELYDISEKDKEPEAKTERKKYTDKVVELIGRTKHKIYAVWGEGDASSEVVKAFQEVIEKRGVQITIASYGLKSSGIRQLAKEGKITVRKTPSREKFHTTVYDEVAYVNEFHPNPNNEIRKITINQNDRWGATKNLGSILKVYERSELVPPDKIDSYFPQ